MGKDWEHMNEEKQELYLEQADKDLAFKLIRRRRDIAWGVVIAILGESFICAVLNTRAIVPFIIALLIIIIVGIFHKKLEQL